MQIENRRDMWHECVRHTSAHDYNQSEKTGVFLTSSLCVTVGMSLFSSYCAYIVANAAFYFG